MSVTNIGPCAALKIFCRKLGFLRDETLLLYVTIAHHIYYQTKHKKTEVPFQLVNFGLIDLICLF